MIVWLALSFLVVALILAGRALAPLLLFGRRSRSDGPRLGLLFMVFSLRDFQSAWRRFLESRGWPSAPVGFFHFWLGWKPVMVATTPDAAKFVLVEAQAFHKTNQLSSTRAMNEFFGENLVSAEGDVWRRQRTVINSAFHFDALASYYATFDLLTCRAVARLAVQTRDGAAVNVVPLLQAFTVDVLGQVAFGYDFGNLEQRSADDPYYAAYKWLFEALSNPLLRLFPFIEFLPLPLAWKLRASIRSLEKLFEMVVAHRRQQQGKAVASAADSPANGNVDLLDLLLHASEGTSDGEATATLSIAELRANLFIFFVAGHETTATALSWALFELANNAHEQEAIVAELAAVFDVGGTADQAISMKQLMSFETLRRFVDENMRLHPPVSMLPTRVAADDVTWNGQTMPRGSVIAVDIRNIHRSPAHWENPDEFDSSRFSSERSHGRHPFAYLPFSLGRRKCIGNNFSLVEQRLFLAKLLLRFKVVFGPYGSELETRHNVLLDSPTCVSISLEPRKLVRARH